MIANIWHNDESEPEGSATHAMLKDNPNAPPQTCGPSSSSSHREMTLQKAPLLTIGTRFGERGARREFCRSEDRRQPCVGGET